MRPCSNFMKAATVSIAPSAAELTIAYTDPQRSAEVIDLEYVRDSQPGIRRHADKNGFTYWYRGRKIANPRTLERIRKMAIPPAWRDVWICARANGHLQATGYDARNRKQYRYHSLWSERRNETKFHRLYAFGKSLPIIRRRLERDLRRKALCEEKVLATAIELMERTYIRIGNEGYEKMNGSYGLTTLKDKHVKIDRNGLRFSFRGKKGIYHDVTIRNRRLARIVKACRDIPGRELFQYYADDGTRRSIDSGKVNQYIRDAAGDDFSAKDFRVWAGSLHCLRALQRLSTEHPPKQAMLAALDEVSRRLGNTRAVCRKYYVHPGLLRLYEEGTLDQYLEEVEHEERSSHSLTADEKVLMKVLKVLQTPL